MSAMLTDIYGKAFTDFNDPNPPGSERRGNWQSLSTKPSKKQIATQYEQRIVDVCLHDVLAWVHSAAPLNGSWLAFGDGLRARHKWERVGPRLAAAMSSSGIVSDDDTRGFFWSAVLAATAKVLAATAAMPSRAQIVAEISRPSAVAPGVIDPIPAVPSMAKVAYPRLSCAKVIEEVRCSSAVDIATAEVESALRATALGWNDQLVVIGTVGITVCPDLWRFPTAVRYLLIPTIVALRRRGARFSLDGIPGPGDQVEALIRGELREKWNRHNGRGGLW
ncbi:MAG: hypothetical protein QM774_06800 [Gordonia sp. (in: high G+C Gram-positive bacteria)]|uniref:hypothetical protein n=1 Tax=Gordonia sp. (in: high G+C Gram-positive bacteria) TaxID=84139 RepID=UPI0039E2D636